MPFNRRSGPIKTIYDNFNNGKEENESWDFKGQQKIQPFSINPQYNPGGDRPGPYQRYLRSSSRRQLQSYVIRQTFQEPQNTDRDHESEPGTEPQMETNEISQENVTKIPGKSGEGGVSEVKEMTEQEASSVKKTESCETQAKEMSEVKEIKQSTNGQTDSLRQSDNDVVEGNCEKHEVTLEIAQSSEKIASPPLEKKKFKKGNKLPSAIRLRRMNNRLSRILTPKSALTLLHQLKPTCTYKVQEYLCINPPQFSAQVEFNGEILGAGQGMSKSQSKMVAAENAIKAIVSKAMSKNSADKIDGGDGAMDVGGEEEGEDSIPWAGLASFALFKLFSEWQNQGVDFSLNRPKEKPKDSSKSQPIKELPPNASELHPTTALNLMKPGITAVELHREAGPNNSRVTMGYQIDGQMYTGIGTNKKDAKKEAAKSAMFALWGVKYA